MGLFDITINKELNITKDELISKLEKKLNSLSAETIKEKDSLLFKNFKADGALLTYDLNIVIQQSKSSISLNIFGELLNVWFMVVIIVLGILYTYGVAIIILVAFAYYQKKVSTQFLNKLLDKLTDKKEV